MIEVLESITLIPLDLLVSIVGCAISIAMLVEYLREHPGRTILIMLTLAGVSVLIGAAAYQAHQHEEQIGEAYVQIEKTIPDDGHGKTFDEIQLRLTPLRIDPAVLAEAMYRLLEAGKVMGTQKSFLDEQGNDHQVFLYTPAR